MKERTERMVGGIAFIYALAMAALILALPGAGEPVPNGPTYYQAVGKAVEPLVPAHGHELQRLAQSPTDVPAGEVQPDVPARKPDDDTMITQCSASDFVYGHAWMDVKVATMGVVHPDGRHEAPIIVYTFNEKMDIVKLWYNGTAVADVDAWIKTHSNLCAYMIQKDS